MDDQRSQLRRVVASAVFVWLFLRLFEPFGLSRVPAAALNWQTICYGLITGAGLGTVYLLLPRLLVRWFLPERWVVWKAMVALSMAMLLITLGNAAFTQYVWRGHWSGTADLTAHVVFFLWVTPLTAIFPVALILARYRIQRLRRHLHEVRQALPPSTPPMPAPDRYLLRADNGREHVQFASQDLLLVSAADNYVEVFVMHAGQVQKVLLRTPLKKVAEALATHPQMFRAHRSHLVNLARYVRTQADGDSAWIWLEGISHPIPLAQNRRKALADIITDMPTKKPSPKEDGALQG